MGLVRRGGSLHLFHPTNAASGSSSDCVSNFSVYWLFGGELFLIFFVAAVGFIAGFFLCHFGLVVLVGFP